MKTKKFVPLSILFLGIMALLLGACREDDESPSTPPPPPPPYGTGALSFTESDSSRFSANGLYVPSTEVAANANATGAGGFLYDLVFGGKRLKGEIMSYRHALSGSVLEDRVFLVELYDSSSAFETGSYDLVRPDTTALGKFAVATYIFYSNPTGLYYVYQSRRGSVTISTADLSTNHLTGFFSGTLRSLDDTTNFVQIVHGEFDVSLGSEYFIYKPGIR